MTPTCQRDWLTLEELADWLGRSPQTIYKWNWTGVGPAHTKIGGKCFYRIADIEAWLKERRTECFYRIADIEQWLDERRVD